MFSKDGYWLAIAGDDKLADGISLSDCSIFASRIVSRLRFLGRGAIETLAFTSVGERLANGDSDGHGVLDFRFVDNDQSLQAVVGDGSLITWNLDIDYLLKLSCTTADRD